MVQKVSLLFLSVLVRYSGPISTWEGGGEGGRGVLNETRVATSCQKIK